MLTGCIYDYCDNPYTNSEVWIANGTSEPLYYTFSDTPHLTPVCLVRPLPLRLASITHFRQFTPLQVLTDPTYTPNGHHNNGEQEGYFPYLLLLRYNDSIVACYDISRSGMARADYPWFTTEADSTQIKLDWFGCEKPETTYVYTYYITDSIL